MNTKIIFFFTLLFVAVAMAVPAPNAEAHAEQVDADDTAVAEIEPVKEEPKLQVMKLCLKTDKACMESNPAYHH